MTKEEFVTKLAGAGKVTKKQADEMFSAFVGDGRDVDQEG